MVLPNLVRIEDISEFLFSAQFSRPDEPDTKIVSEKGTYHPRNSLNHLTGKEWIHFSRSWFVHKPKPRNKKKGEDLHPAKYPEDLISRFIEFFTKKGAWVLDPFSGTASTLVAAESVERNAVGFEISEKWANIGANRTNQYVILGNVERIRSISHLPKFDFCISSPPYWDMLHASRGGSDSTQKDRIKKGYDATFSSLEDDLGNVKEYDKFMETLLLIYDNIRLKMKKGAYCVVIMQNTLKAKQQFFPLAWEFALKMRERGWKLLQEMIWCQSDKKLGIWGYPNTYISNVHHHYCLVFQVP